MIKYEFFILLFKHLGIYFISLLINSIPIYFIAKKYSRSWIDPLRIAFIFVVFANAVPLFLFFIKKIPEYLFYYFILSEFLFWLAFVVFAKRKIVFSKMKIVNEEAISNKVFFIFLFLFILINIITYIKFGFPIFQKSRLDIFVNSGGFGIISRLNPFISLYLLMYSYYQLGKRCTLNYRIIVYFVFTIIAIKGILSGSRGSFLGFIYSYFGYLYFYKGNSTDLRKLIKYVPFILSGALIVLLITNNGNLFLAFGGLLERFASTGDCYYMAYPNEIINRIDGGNSTFFLLSNLLAPLRLIDISNIPPPLGAQLTWELIPSIQGTLVGPNSRPPILGFVLFGWNGLIFSFILGIFTSILIFRISSLFPKGFLSSVLLFFTYSGAISLITDPTYGIACMFDTVLNFSILCFLILLLSVPKKFLWMKKFNN